ncbi:uncharacterized protein LOC144637401 isoform X1 [Oculina patagonica]
MVWWQVLSLTSFVCFLHTSDSVRWPAGTYGIPKPASGCPLADGFQWQEGWRSQDTDGTYSNNAKSAEFHLDGKVDSEKVNRSFCIKTSLVNDKNRPDWPPGQYCMYKEDQGCPTGFTEGSVYWDDDDSNNANSKGGLLPGGKYSGNTWIYFCCKTEGDKVVPILLPTKSPFYLLAYKSKKCQMAKWAVATVEWIYYDTEHFNNKDKVNGAYPYKAGKKHPTIYYCYYRGCSVTLTASNGTFQSLKISDAQYCSWRIMVNTTQYIHLTINYFSQQDEDGIDELYVYDGENATGEVLGVFNGSHPPPKEGIYSSSNCVFVIFKSDKNGANTGFNASYYGVKTPGNTTDSVRWPGGKYGIPKPASGCPLADGFQWQEGWRSQGTNGTYSDNEKSAEFHIDGKVDSEKVNRSFCIKKSRAGPNWPPGQYCIYKFKPCPDNLTQGSVFWDDDNTLKANSEGGLLPGGKYNENTWIYFCCKTDGNKAEPIHLPTKSPFYLLAYKSKKCQMVKWAVASLEWIYYDTERRNNKDRVYGEYPYDAGKNHPTIYYCYYRGCSGTLSASSGTLQSPNISDAQYCSWRIIVNTTQYIHLAIKYFSQQDENGSDELYVYDGENATGEVLGVFNGSHPPPEEGIYSSSNRIFIIFKSDKNGSNTGFSASYCGINTLAMAPCVTTTKRPELTTLPSVTPKTLHTTENTASSKETIPATEGPSKDEGEKGQRGRPKGKGFSVIAVVVPIVSGFILIVLLVPAFVYWRRKKTKKDASKVSFSRASGDGNPISVGNPYYGRDVIIANTHELYTEPITKQKKKNGEEHYMDLIQKNRDSLYETTATESDLVIANTNGKCLSEETELYTEPVTKHERKNGEEHYLDLNKENQESLYETADVDAVLNPVYESSPCRNTDEELPLYMELEKENPLYEVSTADAVLNPIYDRLLHLKKDEGCPRKEDYLLTNTTLR